MAALLALLAACGDPLEETRDVPANLPWRGMGSETKNYVIRNRNGEEVSRGTLTLEEEGERVAFVQHYENQEGTDDVRVEADAATLRPRRMTRSIQTQTLQREVTAEYGSDRVQVTITGEDPTSEELEFPAHAYDAEESLWLWRTLPFAVGYEVKYVAINPNRPTGRVATARVVAIETVPGPAGTFEAWRVEVSAAGSRLVAWYDTKAPHTLVRYETGEFVYELAE